MPARRVLVNFAVASASVLVVASAQSQTLLWSARYDFSTQSGQGSGLGPGRPFRVDGSGGVTLAGLASSTQYFLLRYKPDGAFDQMSLQTPLSPFSGHSVVVDRQDRAVWAGWVPPPGGAPWDILTRHSFGNGWESLYNALGWGKGVLVEESVDGSVFLVYNWFANPGFHAVMKLHDGAAQPDWSTFLGVLDARVGSIRTSADPAGGLVISDSFGHYLERIDGQGTVIWQDSALPFTDSTPAIPVIGAVGRVHASGPTPTGDFGTVTLDVDGKELWRRTFDGAGHGSDVPTGIAADIGGGVHVTGSSMGAGGTSDYATVKYDSAGNLLWARTYDGGGEDRPAGVVVDSAGNAWVTGVSGNDVVTLKYDPAGNQVFSHRFVSPGPAAVAGVALDSWGNATVAFSAAGNVFALRYGEAPVRIGPLSLRSLDPCRAFDSRESALGGPNPLAGPSDHVLALAGVCGVPATAKAVALNVTAVGATQPGNLVLFPAGQTVPLTSVINYAAGQTRANNATVGLGPNAGLGLHVSQGGGTVHVLVDVVGYWQ